MQILCQRTGLAAESSVSDCYIVNSVKNARRVMQICGAVQGAICGRAANEWRGEVGCKGTLRKGRPEWPTRIYRFQFVNATPHGRPMDLESPRLSTVVIHQTLYPILFADREQLVAASAECSQLRHLEKNYKRKKNK